MYRANFRSVFIGIETPRLDSLNETKKFQNVRGDTLEAKLARIHNAGLDINAGFIVGFDSDDKDDLRRTSFGLFRKMESRWRWSACCRRFPGRHSTNGSKGRAVWSRKTPAATSSPSK